MGYITFLDENLYKKKERALAKYFRGIYKDLIFCVIPKLKKDGKRNGVYQYEIETDELFKKVYGPITIQFSVQNDIAIIEDILPSDLLLACYERDLPVHNGIPYRNEIDLKKIKMMEAILCQNGKKN